jgi:fructokinase
MDQPHFRIGIDFGGTKTEIIVLDGRNGKELYRKRVPTVKGDYQATLKSFKDLIEEAEKQIGAQATIGVGIPGSVSRDNGLVKNANTTWMNGQPLKRDLESMLGREVRIQNDANCLAVSEATDGAGVGANVVFAMIIGTGFGAGVVVDGKPLDGINGIAGEWGHNTLPYPRLYAPVAFDHGFPKESENPPRGIVTFTHDKSWAEYPGPLCYCGRAGCQEMFVSGTGFKLDYQRVTGEELSTHDIITHAMRGEPKARAALDRFMDRLARSISAVIHTIDPDVIVLGGGMSNVDAIYEDVPKIWGKYIDTDKVHTPLKPSRHGDSSGIRGAAWLWPMSD